MGEPLLAAHFQTLLDKLGPLLNFAHLKEFRSELRTWRSKLLQVRLVLCDAEERQMNDREVKNWLDNLRDLAYNVEDVLDELGHETLQRQNNSSSDSAASSSQVQDLLAQMKEITTSFLDIEQDKSDLRLEERPGVRSSIIITNRLPTTSLVDSSQIVGREKDIDVKNISNGLQCLTSLTGLQIGNCKNLRTLPGGIISSNSNLQLLWIGNCGSLESFGSGVLPSTLKKLFIWNCRKLESISEMLLGPTSPDSVYFRDYPNLKGLPQCLCTNLTYLRIHKCESIESFPETPNLAHLEICCCMNLKYLPIQDALGLYIITSTVVRAEPLRCIKDGDYCIASV
ncbi:Rx, N-terminal [Dillenia turbinata]|uniref:Rx, N-terminal n=1 Tax=Dillenia turbinata TaxID=194707 RepID=A0AAN8V7D9_9MAGN